MPAFSHVHFFSFQSWWPPPRKNDLTQTQMPLTYFNEGIPLCIWPIRKVLHDVSSLISAHLHTRSVDCIWEIPPMTSLCLKPEKQLLNGRVVWTYKFTRTPITYLRLEQGNQLSTTLFVWHHPELSTTDNHETPVENNSESDRSP